MNDPTLGSWYVGNKVLSRTSVVVVRNPSCAAVLGSRYGGLN
jgi:hypothetical protein